MPQLQELVRLHRLGNGPVAVARSLGLDRKTERRYRRMIQMAGLLQGAVDDLPELQLLRDAVAHPTAPPLQEQSSVAGYADDVQRGIQAGIGPTAIYELLMEANPNFHGSLSAIKRLYKRLKKAGGPSPDDVVIPVHTVAGREAQVDFGYVGRLRDSETGRMRNVESNLRRISVGADIR